ncbi:excisionase family DNA binding protein [Arthrobacter sp. SORGH_AS 212]|uniref:helix-turn-helix domain-containing protein n=1 Tax=Pseudarthrobacter sp. SORGH_AS 212 TaxID=3041777 RepID=UPI002789D303|nr:excisionase family DNA binding protein [Arthrobacter sp. SORGH_AS_0212]
MALIAPRVTAGLPTDDAGGLARALRDSDDITVFVDGTVHRLPAQARDAVVDLLARLSRGEAVTVSSVEEMLTTSRAAELAGISHTYLRNMTDRGEIPVEYRGTHRRIRQSAILAWLETQRRKEHEAATDGGLNGAVTDGPATDSAGGSGASDGGAGLR